MQAYGYLAFGPTSFDGGGGGGGGISKSIGPSNYRSRRVFKASASANKAHRNHYAVLGVSPAASFSDIKRAYRQLALKHHPDVNKDVGANEAFKNIRLAYDILINETSRNEYDQALQNQENFRSHSVNEWASYPEYDDGIRFYKWAYLRRKKRYERYWAQYQARDNEFSVYEDTDEMSKEDNDKETVSFIEVLKSVFLSLFLMQTVGIRLSLTYSSLLALIDRKLDRGYKFGYLLAWILGGRGGILLTMFLTFASWVCGKTSSSIVALVVVAMWFGSNLAMYAPIPQGALLTLLYMSIKLQVDLN